MYESISIIHSKTGQMLNPDNATLRSIDINPYITTKSFLNKKIYYEITHIKGQNCYLAGFILHNAGVMYLYPMCSDEYISLYAQSNVHFSIENFQGIPTNILKNNYTIGLSVDPFLHTFSIYHEQQTISFNYTTTSSSTLISPAFREQYTNGITEDILFINFGSHPFKYELPHGYSPWQSIFLTIKSDIISVNFLFLNIIITRSHNSCS